MTLNFSISPASITQTSGSASGTITISVKAAAYASAATRSGNIRLSTTDGDNVDVPITLVVADDPREKERCELLVSGAQVPELHRLQLQHEDNARRTRRSGRAQPRISCRTLQERDRRHGRRVYKEPARIDGGGAARENGVSVFHDRTVTGVLFAEPFCRGVQAPGRHDPRRVQKRVLQQEHHCGVRNVTVQWLGQMGLLILEEKTV